MARSNRLIPGWFLNIAPFLRCRTAALIDEIPVLAVLGAETANGIEIKMRASFG